MFSNGAIVLFYRIIYIYPLKPIIQPLLDVQIFFLTSIFLVYGKNYLLLWLGKYSCLSVIQVHRGNAVCATF